MSERPLLGFGPIYPATTKTKIRPKLAHRSEPVNSTTYPQRGEIPAFTQPVVQAVGTSFCRPRISGISSHPGGPRNEFPEEFSPCGHLGRDHRYIHSLLFGTATYLLPWPSFRSYGRACVPFASETRPAGDYSISDRETAPIQQ